MRYLEILETAYKAPKFPMTTDQWIKRTRQQDKARKRDQQKELRAEIKSKQAAVARIDTTMNESETDEDLTEGFNEFCDLAQALELWASHRAQMAAIESKVARAAARALRRLD